MDDYYFDEDDARLAVARFYASFKRRFNDEAYMDEQRIQQDERHERYDRELEVQEVFE